LAQRIALRPTGQRLGDFIEVGHARVDVGGDDRVPDAAQGDAQQFALPARPDLGKAHGLAESDDERAGEQIRQHPDQLAGVVEAETATRFDEEVVAGEVADDRNQTRRPIAAHPHGSGNGTEQCHERQRRPQHRIEQLAQQHRGGERRDRQPISSGTSSHCYSLGHLFSRRTGCAQCTARH
jgi:hypothetical protein